MRLLYSEFEELHSRINTIEEKLKIKKININDHKAPIESKFINWIRSLSCVKKSKSESAMIDNKIMETIGSNRSLSVK